MSHMEYSGLKAHRPKRYYKKFAATILPNSSQGRHNNYWPDRQGGHRHLIVYQIEKENIYWWSTPLTLIKTGNGSIVNKEFGATLTNASDALSLLAARTSSITNCSDTHGKPLRTSLCALRQLLHRCVGDTTYYWCRRSLNSCHNKDVE